MGDRLLVIVDADTLAGWRQPKASLAQLHAAVADLRRQAPDTPIAVVGDPSLKWALSEPEREVLDDDIRHRRIVFAPAGACDGHVGFIARIADKAKAQGLTPVTITDRAVPGARLVRIRREGVRWVFDLDGAAEATVVATGSPVRRRRSRG